MKALQCFFLEFWHLEIEEQPWADTTVPRHDPHAPPEVPMNNTGWCVNMPSNTRLCHIRSSLVDDLITYALPKYHLVGGRPGWLCSKRQWSESAGDGELACHGG